MTDRLTDERLEEMERFALALDRSDMRALIAELRALRRAESVINVAREMACEVRSGGPLAPATIRALVQAVEDLDGGELRCPPDELAQCRATVEVLMWRERALREENAALRRVAEAAERAHRRAERLDHAPDDQWAMRSQEWREAHRALGEAVADWRRVRGE